MTPRCLFATQDNSVNLWDQSLTSFHSNKEWAFSEWHLTMKIQRERKSAPYVYTIVCETGAMFAWTPFVLFGVKSFWLMKPNVVFTGTLNKSDRVDVCLNVTCFSVGFDILTFAHCINIQSLPLFAHTILLSLLIFFLNGRLYIFWVQIRRRQACKALWRAAVIKQ